MWDRLQQEITSSVTLAFLSPLNPRPIKDQCGLFHRFAATIISWWESFLSHEKKPNGHDCGRERGILPGALRSAMIMGLSRLKKELVSAFLNVSSGPFE